MITVLGIEKCKNNVAYNIHCSYESKKDGLRGVQVATVYTKADTYESQFANVEPGDQVAIDVGWSEIKLKDAKVYEWRPFFRL